MSADDVTARARATASNAFAYGRSKMDSVVHPETRQKYFQKITTFATQRPITTSFILFQLLFSFIPLVFFLSFAVSTLCFALVSAFCFTFFWIGVALCVLVPTLFVTFSIGLVLWLWALAAFMASRYIYSFLAPYIPEGFGGSTADGKQVIFPYPKGGVDIGENIKAEASEIKE